MDNYTDALVSEIELTGEMLNKSETLLNAVYIGGGTLLILEGGVYESFYLLLKELSTFK